MNDILTRDHHVVFKTYENKEQKQKRVI